MQFLIASEIPRTAKPAGVVRDTVACRVVLQVDQADIRWSVTVIDPAGQRSCHAPAEGAEGRAPVIIAGTKLQPPIQLLLVRL